MSIWCIRSFVADLFYPFFLFGKLSVNWHFSTLSRWLILVLFIANCRACMHEALTFYVFFLLFWDFRDYLSKRFRFVYMYVLLTAVCMSVFFFCFCYRPIIRAKFTSERRVFFKELGATFCNICIYFLLYLFVGRWAHASSLRVADKSGSNG